MSSSKLGSLSKIPALMRAGKEMFGEETKKKTKKEQLIDKKIEYLLETYKKQDEELLKKADQKSNKHRAARKNLRDKFGFSDDEDEGDDDKGEESQASFTKQVDKSEDFANTGKFNTSSQQGSLPAVKTSINKKNLF